MSITSRGNIGILSFFRRSSILAAGNPVMCINEFNCFAYAHSESVTVAVFLTASIATSSAVVVLVLLASFNA